MLDFIIYAIAIGISAYFLPGIKIDGVVWLLITTLVLAIINALIKPALNFIALPLNILTMGLFSFVINAALIMLAAVIVPGFKVESFWWALLFGAILAFISEILMQITKRTHLHA